MPSMEDHHGSKVVKLLFLGDSGTGKTGALCSLADAGYKLRILDMDNGANIIRSMFTAAGSRYKRENLKNIHYVTLTDTVKFISGSPSATKAKSWPEAVAMLNHWREKVPGVALTPGTPPVPPVYENDFGPLTTWTEKDVLVIDSLTFLGKACLNYELSLNSHLGQRPTQPEWGLAQNRLESILAMLYDDDVTCNIVMTAHLKYKEESDGALGKGSPVSLGKALDPLIGRYFNDTIMIGKSGIGKAEKRVIMTSSNIATGSLIELKSSNPLAVKAEYPIETGLADYFRDVKSGV